MSWKAEWIRGGEWRSDASRYATKEEAQAACFHHHVRKGAFWYAGPVTKMRIVECDDPVTGWHPIEVGRRKAP